ncbi:RNA-binding domain-containing protein [Peniophora sp. CONT]|nr:RNA-binding domain-containing protein [Peniophora sp. CONT]
MASSSTQPNTTLYINNLNDQVQKDELRQQLYALFTTYGKLIDVVALKTTKMRGQAFLVFTDLGAATSALRACDGMLFYDKPMRIQYAKSKSHATLKREDPDFIPPTAPGAANRPKRDREEDVDGGAGRAKREKPAEDDSEGEEMELDDDEDEAPSTSCTYPHLRETNFIVKAVKEKPSHRLLCSNLPLEATDPAVSSMFQTYRGFLSAAVALAPEPNAQGQKVKMAQVMFDSSEAADQAKQALDGYTLRPGWIMSVKFIN